MATYHVSQVDGNDTYDGLYETWQGGTNGPWLTIAKADNLSGDQSDNFVLFNRGGTWRESWTLACNGTSGHPFTIGAYGSGDLPKIYGSTQVSTWTDEGGNLWYATCTTDPYSVWFINTDTSIVWGKEETLKTSLNTEFDWWWDDPNDRLYVYAATDPDTRYTSVEKGRGDQQCIYLGAKSYITLSYLELAFATNGSDGHGIRSWNQAYGTIIEYVESHHHGVMIPGNSQGNGIIIYDTDNLIVRHCKAYENARRGIAVFGHTDSSTHLDNDLIEYNEVYNNFHAQIDGYIGSSSSNDNMIVRYNLVYTNADYGARGEPKQATHGILFQQKSTGLYNITNPKCYYNIVINMYEAYGIWVDGRIDDALIYNNVVYSSGQGAFSPGICVTYETTHAPSGVIIKNNIAYAGGTGSGALYVVGSLTYISQCENNLWYNPEGSGIYAQVVGSVYHSDDQAAYRTATGWDDAPGGLWENPDLVNASGTTAADYQLTSVSPCRDAGVDVSLTEDYWGNSVPYNTIPDIGAHEYTIYTLTMSDAFHTQVIDSIALTQAHGLSIGDSFHAHSIDGIALTQLHNLSVSDSFHIHLSDNLIVEPIEGLKTYTGMFMFQDIHL